MKTLISKHNPSIRITAPEITIEAAPYNNHQYVYWIPAINQMYNPIDWTLVEEEEQPVDLEKEIKMEWEKEDDEMVRKIITDSVFYQYGAGAEYKDVLDYLDRLEKQREQKHVDLEK